MTRLAEELAPEGSPAADLQPLGLGEDGVDAVNDELLYVSLAPGRAVAHEAMLPGWVSRQVGSETPGGNAQLVGCGC